MRTAISTLCFILLLTGIANAQTPEKVVNKYVDFIGGREAWKKIKTITTSGTYDYGGIVFPFTTYAKGPNHYKFIVPLNGKFYAQAFDGIKGWKIDAFKSETKATPLAGKDALAMANEADVELEDPFIDYQAKGHKVLVEGEETINNIKCSKIKLVRKGGIEDTYYFNNETGAIVKKIAISKNVEMNGSPLDILYSDYRMVNNIRLPFKLVHETNGQMILTIIVEKAVLDQPIDDKEFQP